MQSDVGIYYGEESVAVVISMNSRMLLLSVYWCRYGGPVHAI